MSIRCPAEYSRYKRTKKNKYYDKCCKTGLEPSEEVCLTDQQVSELNQKLDNEKQVKSALEKEEKSIKAAEKSIKAKQKRIEASEMAAKKASETAAKKALKETMKKPPLTKKEEIERDEKRLNNFERTIKEQIRDHIPQKSKFKRRYYDDDDDEAVNIKAVNLEDVNLEDVNIDDDEISDLIMKFIRAKANLQKRKEDYALEVLLSKKDIFPPPPPGSLRRQLSTNIVKQMTGDCFAHASTRVFLRMISREFFEKPEDPFHSIKEDACDDLYLIKEPFSVFSKTHNIEELCKNPGNYNSILMYFFLHKITIDKFDCQGGMPDFVLFYLLRIFNDLKNRRITLDKICNLGNPKYCEHLQPIIEQFGLIETKYTAQFMHYTQDLMDKVKTPDELIEHQNKFFDKIQQIIDLGLYVSLNINGLIPSIKTPTKTIPDARTTILNTSEFLEYSNRVSGNTTRTQLSQFSGDDHAVTIVDYDYSKPSKQLKIKNSWGKSEHSKDIYIYISKSDLDLSPDQVRIDYLEPTNEYSLADLAALNESVSDKLPAYRPNHLMNLTEDEHRTRYLNVFRKWNIVAIIFNSTNTINSFFEKYRINSIEMTDIMADVLFISTNSMVFDKMVSEDILRNVFDCIIVNLKRYRISSKNIYRGWINKLKRNKRSSPVVNPELNEYFEEELKNLFPKTCSESVFGSCLPTSMRHFSRREGRGKTKKNRQKQNNKKDNKSKKRRRRRRKNTKK